MPSGSKQRTAYVPHTCPGDRMKLSLLTALIVLQLIMLNAFAADPPKQNMQKVLGIGGLFFKADDPDRLAKWYETYLGISPIPTDYDQKPWRQEAGPTAFAPFKTD